MIEIVLHGIVEHRREPHSGRPDGYHYFVWDGTPCERGRRLVPEKPGDDVYLEMPWLLSMEPAVGHTIELFDGTGAQQVMVQEISHGLDGTIDVYIGGWNNWEPGSVERLFERSRSWFSRRALSREINVDRRLRT